jgi:hypothetical protein
LSETSESIAFDAQIEPGLGERPCPRDDSQPCAASADEQVALALFEVWIAARKTA